MVVDPTSFVIREKETLCKRGSVCVCEREGLEERQRRDRVQVHDHWIVASNAKHALDWLW